MKLQNKERAMTDKITPKLCKQEMAKMGIDHSIINQFFEYHAQNSHIWQEFEKRCLNAISSGAKRIGAKAIMEDIRRDPDVSKNGALKIHNTWTAYYARIFAIKHKNLAHYFVFKGSRGIGSNNQTIFRWD